MPFLHQFANDAFISYAHVDNTDNHWVDEFRTRLRNRLVQIGAQVEIWKDDKLTGNDDFSDEIMQQLAASGVLISVVTPSSFQSHWCERERQKFEELAREGVGFQIENKLRAFKIVKTPIDNRRDRELFPNTVGYEFFEFKPNGQWHEFQPGTPEFDDKLDSLAQELKAMLEHLRTHLPDKPAVKKRVYLAETADGLVARRNQLRAQLEDWGYVVVPSDPFERGNFYADDATRNMKECLLSVHLVGSERGAIPGDENEPIGVLQYNAAAALGLVRVVWFSPGESPHGSILKALDEGNQDKLNRLETVGFEELKDIVGEKLKRCLEQPPPAIGSTDGRTVYLVCHNDDHPYFKGARDPNPTTELQNYLEKQGFRVWLPPASVISSAKWRSDFRKSLKLSDAVVLYWGSASEEWFRATLQNFIADQKARGNRPFVVRAIYLSRPEANEKKQYKKNYLDMCIEQFNAFREEVVRPLVQKLQT